MKKIVIIGPESTGKSTLCEQLAAHYDTLWCPEYAREYLLKHGTDYGFNDLLTIAKGQLALEDKYTSLMDDRASKSAPASERLAMEKQPLFIDTDMYVMKVWCEFVFENCHRFILEEIVSRKYDLYLLCNVDLPWVKDELREYPDLENRQKLYHIYKDIMVNQAVPWIEISGGDGERMERAVGAIEEMM